MNCNQCNLQYDLADKIPKMLTKCGHTICLSCLSKLCCTSLTEFKCPFDNVVYSLTEIFPTNSSVLEIIQKFQINEILCPIHCKKQEIYCVDCKLQICSDCALFEGHKMHLIESIENAQVKEQQRYSSLVEKMSHYKELVINGEAFCRNLKTELENDNVEVVNEFYDKIYSKVEESRKKVIKQISKKIEDNQSMVTSMKQTLEKVSADMREYELNGKQIGTFIKLETEISKDTKMLERNLKSQKFIVELKESNLKLLKKQNWESVLDEILEIKLEEEEKQPAYFTKNSNNPEKYLAIDESIDPEENLLHENIQSIKDSKNYKSPMKINDSNSVSKFSKYSPNLKLTHKKAAVSKSPNSINSVHSSRLKTLHSVNRPLASSGQSLYKNRQPSQTLSNNNKDSSMHKENRSGNTSCRSISPFLCVDKIKEKYTAIIERALASGEETVDLSNIELTNAHLKGVASLLATLPRLTTLNLSSNNLTDDGLKVILKGIMPLSIEYIFITGNKLGDYALDFFISFYKYNDKLKGIYLRIGKIICTLLA